MSLVVPMIGSAASASSSGGLARATPFSSRPRMLARSNRNPSMWYSATHQRRQFEDEFADHRVVAVERVAAATEVLVTALRREQVPGPVVQAAERERRPILAPLRRVVEDDVENDLDAVFVQLLDERLEFIDLHAGPSAGRVSRFRGTERQRVVAPVVEEPLPRSRVPPIDLALVELEDGHQLDTVDAQLLEKGYLFAQPGERTWELHPRGGAAGEAAARASRR